MTIKFTNRLEKTTEKIMAEWLMGGYHIQHQSLPLFIGSTLGRLSGKTDCSKWVDSDT